MWKEAAVAYVEALSRVLFGGTEETTISLIIAGVWDEI
jgi:hypothetical protein